MSGNGLTRRSSYGPRSPVVGERGARTRQRLLDIALRRFADHGFHAARVDDIAREAGVSRATFYQYFDSREELIEELLEECGASLVRVVRRLGPLSATAAGYDNLHWWLGEWAYVYDKYATIFVEWSHIDGPATPLRPMVTQFVERYTAELAPHLEQAGVQGLEPGSAALMLQTLIERFNYYRLTQLIGCSDRELLDTLAVIIQRLLFPQTPAAAFTVALDPVAAGQQRVPLHLRRSGGAEPDPAGTALATEAMSDPARRSVDQLVAAGAQVFAGSGYRGSSVEEILTVAGLSRRTFYKYFGSRLDLLMVVSARCADLVGDLAAQLAEAVGGEDPAAGVRAWCESVVRFGAAEGGILRVWLEEPVTAALERDSQRALAALASGFTDVLNGTPSPPSFSPTAAAWLLIALVERVPHQAVSTRYDVTGDRLVDLMSAIVLRGLLSEERSGAAALG